MTRRTRIQHRDFTCKGESHHQFRAAVRIQISDDGALIERTAEFRPIGDTAWLNLPLCLECGELAEESSTYDPRAASIPESERMEVWLSPDGQRVAVPGKRDAQMPDRYAVSGYRRIDAHSIRDIDRIESIRARQTGNEITSEMQMSAETRRWNEQAPYDPDSMTSII